MNIEQIRELWQPGYRDLDAGIALWNGKAQFFADRELPTADSSLTMRIIQREGMVFPGCTALDVGCGGGRFAFALEKLGARASATDFSPEMIRLAAENGRKAGSSVAFSVDDWHAADLAAKGWQGAFDLVLANMTPAVASADTFLKLIKASRGWVLMVKPVGRKNPLLDELRALAGAKRSTAAPDEALACAFDLAWLCGGRPRLEYETQVWEAEHPLEEAVREYTARFASECVLAPGAEEKIRAFLEGVLEDGLVRERSETEVAAMYWRVN